jgi:hypothetical protein
MPCRAAARWFAIRVVWKGRPDLNPKAITERRRQRRVDARLQIELQLDPGAPAQASSTLNISANGVYFVSPRFIAPLTKLGLRLLLPESAPGRDETPVDVTGIVVRCQPEAPAPDVHCYEVACYFTDLGEEFKDRLSHYVHKHL